MKVGLFYVSNVAGQGSVAVSSVDEKDWVGVRMEVVEAPDASEALALSKPRPGEQFLNSMPLPVPA